MQKETFKVFQDMRGAIFVPNVRDAVQGLDGESDLTGPVEFYGDRNIIFPAQTLIRKEARNPEEAMVLAVQDQLLRSLDIGVHEIIPVPSANGGCDGVVARLNTFGKTLRGCKVQAFINTRGVFDVMGKWKAKVLGSDAEITHNVNCKVWQRKTTHGIEGIFPVHRIVESEREIFEAWEHVSHKGEVVAKVGHLASGEGFEVIRNYDQAVAFFKKWQPIILSQGFPGKIILEHKVPLANNYPSVSVQFYLTEETALYVGCSAQHIGGDFTHEGNMTGAEINSRIPQNVESEMCSKALSLLSTSAFAHCRGFCGFDFIISEKGEVLMTEINLRITASTLLFALEAQLGSHLSFDLRKIHVGVNPKVKVAKLMQRLIQENNPENAVIPLNPRLFDKTGDMFLAICAPTFEEIETRRDTVLSWFK